ncbi:sensor histidine kinase [Amycolatopsis sp. H20-H5]|uniref:sensor histidine kinase n=1 Tax=Amycolatopsis sp. H20-H5 TaxID=3046309 RepID=UPI002DB82CB9|nr:nitrate- and nitrite sensing domain-containing protein [Amycolatopsis sp. H20-H5]MEC3979015.1 nitrate- and nitrite sensing domain-containing protein [Amycolatopsis sp. H20-H5]
MGQRRGLSNWRLSRKLAAAFILPTMAALVLAGLRVHDGVAATTVYQRAEQRLSLAGKIASTVGSLQAEREETAAWIAAGRPGDRAKLDESVTASEAAENDVRDTVTLVSEIGDSATTGPYNQALTRLAGLAQLRLSDADKGFPVLAAQESYAGVISALQRVAEKFGADVADRGLQARHDTLVLLSDAKEYSAQQNSYLRAAAVKDQFEPAELRNITTAQSDLLATIDRFTAASTPEAQLDYSNTVAGAQVSQRFQLQQLALMRATAPDPQPLAIDSAAVASSSKATLGLIGKVEARLLDETTRYTHGLVVTQRRAVLTTSAMMLGLLVLALVMMAFVARSMLRPLRRLRITALDVADRQLPEAVARIMGEADPRAAAASAIDPVAVHTTEEIGQVARAFDVVHGEAVRLAAEQAVLRENVRGIFVNLSRRSQRLVERQLGVIDVLEADEQDPDRLARLFELDHLSTRLRRNGESLLVLSGAVLAKSGQRTASAAEVIGAAVSEIEQYTRVEVGAVPDISVQGRVVHDLMHLLAELLDNATFFSDPETAITIRAVVTRHDSLAIQITDRGVGMAVEQLEAANLNLADPPELDASMTRRMGLYVVAKLAQRHRVDVRLRDNQDNHSGVIVRITVPARLLIPNPRSAPTRAPNGRTTPQARSSGPGDPAGRPARSGAPREIAPLALPKQDLCYIPVALAETTGPELGTALDDEVNTSRLPIYQSVLSRWFDPAEQPGDAQDGWRSPADQGWRAADEVLDSASESPVTQAGLPRRVPQTNLLPGTIERRCEPAGKSRPVSATDVRGRMVEFQHGYTSGRHALKERGRDPVCEADGATDREERT